MTCRRLVIQGTTERDNTRRTIDGKQAAWVGGQAVGDCIGRAVKIEAAAVIPTAASDEAFSASVFPLLSSSLTAETSYSSTSVTSMSYDAVDMLASAWPLLHMMRRRRLVIREPLSVTTPVELSMANKLPGLEDRL